MIPIRNSKHVAEGLQRLIDAFKGLAVSDGILTSWLNQVQQFEDVLFGVLQERSLSGVGIQLDYLGSLVGVGRNDRTDAEYRVAISLRTQINRSQGRTTDVISIIQSLTGGQFEYMENPPARFRVYSFASSVFDRPLIDAIRKVKAAGVAFDFQGNGYGITQNEIRYDHVTPTFPDGGFAHTSGTQANNVPVHVVTY